MGPHRISIYNKGETSTQRPPRSVYVHPSPIATSMGFITDTMAAPIEQRAGPDDVVLTTIKIDGIHVVLENADVHMR